MLFDGIVFTLFLFLVIDMYFKRRVQDRFPIADRQRVKRKPFDS